MKGCLLPGGNKKSFGADYENKLTVTRTSLFQEINKLRMIRNLDVEDKKWSVTFHLRGLASDVKERVPAFIKSWEFIYPVKVLEGPISIEILLLPEICEIAACDPDDAQIIYAGDDENDAIAMQWVLMHGGRAFTVGDSPLVPASRVVKNPFQLPLQIYQLCAGITGCFPRGGSPA